jgi:membrane protease YdiL (CAAX protease family)
MSLDPGAPASAATRPRFAVPWDWTDVVIFLATAFIIAPIGILIFGGVASLADGGLSAEVRSAVQSLSEATGVYVAWVAAVLGLVVLRRHGRIRDLGWRGVKVRWLLLAIPIAAATVVGAALMADLSTNLFTHVAPQVTSGQCNSVRHEFGHVVIVAVLLVSVIDPAAEETIFRGFIYGWLRKRLPIGLAVLASAAIFSAAHLDLLLFLPLLGVGAVLALVYEFSGSLLACAAVHGVFNAYNIIAILNAPTC